MNHGEDSLHDVVYKFLKEFSSTEDPVSCLGMQLVSITSPPFLFLVSSSFTGLKTPIYGM